MNLTFSEIRESFTVHRLPPDREVPDSVFGCSFYSISKTEQELSIVCPSSLLLDSEKFEDAWSCIKVLGPLDFSLTGILANISGHLASAGISIFAISTFDTDYLLVKTVSLDKAKEVLCKAGHTFRD